MKTILTTFFIFLVLFCTAQVPGYMGKKLSIMYDPTISLAFYDFGDEKGEEIPNLGINFRNDFEAEYCVTRGLSIGPTLKFSSTKMYNVNVYDDQYGTSGFIGDIKLRSKAFGVKVKNYSFIKRGSIAPVGKYKSFELVYEKSNAETIRYFNYDNPGIPEDVTFEDTGYEPAGQIIFIFGGGGQNIYFDKLLIDLGWEVGISFKHFASTELFEKSYTVYDEESFQQHAGERIAGAYFLNFTFGFGYLVL